MVRLFLRIALPIGPRCRIISRIFFHVTAPEFGNLIILALNTAQQRMTMLLHAYAKSRDANLYAIRSRRAIGVTLRVAYFKVLNHLTKLQLNLLR